MSTNSGGVWTLVAVNLTSDLNVVHREDFQKAGTQTPGLTAVKACTGTAWHDKAAARYPGLPDDRALE